MADDICRLARKATSNDQTDIEEVQTALSQMSWKDSVAVMKAMEGRKDCFSNEKALVIKELGNVGLEPHGSIDKPWDRYLPQDKIEWGGTYMNIISLESYSPESRNPFKRWVSDSVFAQHLYVNPKDSEQIARYVTVKNPAHLGLTRTDKI